MTPQDPDHKAMWEAIRALEAAINLNGYVPILKEIARRYEARREVWGFFKRPLSIATKLAWIVVGAIIWGIANHLFKFWPVGTP